MNRFISHVQLPVNNIEAAVEWYRTYLDCELLANFGEFAVIRFRNDQVNIFLWKTSDDTKVVFTVNGETFPAIGFEVDDMDSLIRSFPNGAVSQDEEGRRFLKFFDLDGNMLVAHT